MSDTYYTHRDIMGITIPGETQNHTPHILSYGRRIAPRCTDNFYTVAVAIVKINMIGANSSGGDQLAT